MFVIPAKAGIHFDFSPGGAATTLLLPGVRMRNPEDSPFVFDSDPPRPGVKTSERVGEKTKTKMDSGFRRNDGGGQFCTGELFQQPLIGRDWLFEIPPPENERGPPRVSTAPRGFSFPAILPP